MPYSSKVNRNRWRGGATVGGTLGVLWSLCVGPIMASVITLALGNAVTLQALLVTLAFSIGTAIPMLAMPQSRVSRSKHLPGQPSSHRAD